MKNSIYMATLATCALGCFASTAFAADLIQQRQTNIPRVLHTLEFTESGIEVNIEVYKATVTDSCNGYGLSEEFVSLNQQGTYATAAYFADLHVIHTEMACPDNTQSSTIVSLPYSIQLEPWQSEVELWLPTGFSVRVLP